MAAQSRLIVNDQQSFHNAPIVLKIEGNINNKKNEVIAIFFDFIVRVRQKTANI